MSAHACELCNAPHSYDSICDDCVRKVDLLIRDVAERAFASVAITFWRAVAASMVKP